LRVNDGRDKNASAAIMDSQSVKTTEQGGAKGYDAGKKVNGRKRHILVDTLGLLLCVKVLAGNIQNRDGAKQLFTAIKERMPRLYLIWADGGYRGKLINWVGTTCLWLLQVVKRNDDVKGFVVLPRRWVVERTFAWLGRNRRLSKDYERKCESSEAFIYVAMIHLMLKRLRPLRT
jgi:putative transposase